MVVSGSTCCPPWQVIGYVFMLQNMVRNLRVYRNHPRIAAASMSLAIILLRIASGLLWFHHSKSELMQLSHHCSGTDVSVVWP